MGVSKKTGRRRRKARLGRPTEYTFGTGRVLAGLVMQGFTTDEAAREIGVSPSTVYRGKNRHPAFCEAMLRAQTIRDCWRYIGAYGPRPRVPWRKDCPECGAAVVVRTAGGMAGFKFWGCEQWEEPSCSPQRWLFASWRPPAQGSCPECGGVLYWSHSRKSVGCGDPQCAYRQEV